MPWISIDQPATDFLIGSDAPSSSVGERLRQVPDLRKIYHMVCKLPQGPDGLYGLNWIQQESEVWNGP